MNAGVASTMVGRRDKTARGASLSSASPVVVAEKEVEWAVEWAVEWEVEWAEWEVE